MRLYAHRDLWWKGVLWTPRMFSPIRRAYESGYQLPIPIGLLDPRVVFLPCVLDYLVQGWWQCAPSQPSAIRLNNRPQANRGFRWITFDIKLSIKKLSCAEPYTLFLLFVPHDSDWIQCVQTCGIYTYMILFATNYIRIRYPWQQTCNFLLYHCWWFEP